MLSQRQCDSGHATVSRISHEPCRLRHSYNLIRNCLFVHVFAFYVPRVGSGIRMLNIIPLRVVRGDWKGNSCWLIDDCFTIITKVQDLNNDNNPTFSTSETLLSSPRRWISLIPLKALLIKRETSKSKIENDVWNRDSRKTRWWNIREIFVLRVNTIQTRVGRNLRKISRQDLPTNTAVIIQIRFNI